MVTAIPGTSTTNYENTLLLRVTLFEYRSRSFRFMVPKLEFGNQQKVSSKLKVGI